MNMGTMLAVDASICKHTGRPIEVVTEMSKSRRFGFLNYQLSDDAFFVLFEELRSDRLNP